MEFSIILIVSLIIFKITLLNKEYHNVYLVIITVIIIIFMFFRDIMGVPDILVYINFYKSLNYKTFNEIIINIISFSEMDPLFTLFSKLFKSLGINYRIWIISINIFFIYSIYRFILNWSKDYFLSYIAFISLGYLFLSFSLLRQTMALSFILFSYKPLLENKKIKFLLFVLIAALFHWSALIFLLSFFIINVKIKIRHFFYIITFYIISFFIDDVITGIISFFGNSLSFFYVGERLLMYSGSNETLNYTRIIIYSLIFMFVFFQENKDENYDKLISFLFFGLIINIFSTIIGEFFRLAIYFDIVSVILIPNAIELESNKYLKSIKYLFLSFILIFYIFISSGYSHLQFMT